MDVPVHRQVELQHQKHFHLHLRMTVVNNCGNSVLTAGSFTGSLFWSNGATTSSITVTTAGTYTVTQTVNGCTSVAKAEQLRQKQPRLHQLLQ